MAEFPALPLWTDAYLADCDHLTDEEHGRYLLLLMHMWRAPNRRFPNDDQWLARKFRRPVERVVAELRPLLAEFFQTDGNWLSHKRLEREWLRLSEMSKKQSERAKSRWDKEKPSSRGNAMRGNATTTTSTTIKKKETPNGVSKERPPALPAVREEPEGFACWYASYPRKVGRDEAAVAYRRALAKASAEELADGLSRARLAWERQRTPAKYIPHPATWLNGGRWADDDFQAGDGTADPIGEADRMTRDILRKMNRHGDPEEFTGTHNVVPDRLAPSVWDWPEDDGRAPVVAERPVH